MTENHPHPCTAFRGHEILCAGPRLEVALAVKRAIAAGASDQIFVFDDVTGKIVDLDLRGRDAEIAERLASPPPGPQGRFRPRATPAPGTESGAKGRGRPRLGVVAREVTLLPRHWDWLSTQRGGASATLRRLVDEARRQPGARERKSAAREAAYNFMQAIAGDLPGYEEALRALFAGDRPTLERLMADWPGDVRSYALRRAFDLQSAPSPESGTSG